jgi:hypothetical protein
VPRLLPQILHDGGADIIGLGRRSSGRRRCGRPGGGCLRWRCWLRPGRRWCRRGVSLQRRGRRKRWRRGCQGRGRRKRRRRGCQGWGRRTQRRRH